MGEGSVLTGNNVTSYEDVSNQWSRHTLEHRPQLLSAQVELQCTLCHSSPCTIPMFTPNFTINCHYLKFDFKILRLSNPTTRLLLLALHQHLIPLFLFLICRSRGIKPIQRETDIYDLRFCSIESG